MPVIDTAALQVQSCAHPSELADDVRAAMLAAEQRNIGFGEAWYRNLADTVYPGDPQLHFYVLRRGAAILAVLPLRAEKMRLGWRLLALGNFYTTLYEPLLDPSASAAELAYLLGAIEREHGQLASMTLAPMDPASPAWRSLWAAMRQAGWFPFDFFSFGNWYQTVDGDWPSFLAAREGQVKSTIKRMGKKFAADGGTLELVSGSGDLARGIAAWERVYAASWKKPEPYPAFMPGLLQTYAEKGFLRLGLAWLNGEAIAAQLWIVSHGRAEIYKLAYHEDFKSYSPGTLITAMLMQHVFEVDQVREVDYLIGDDPYKKTWVGARRERRGIVAYNPRALRVLQGLLVEAAGRAAKRLLARWRAGPA